MNLWIFVSVLLLAALIYLLYKHGQRVRELAAMKLQAQREWILKVALEKTYRLPEVEAQELANIEPQLELLRNGPGADEEKEEKMRLAVMGLYQKKGKRVNSNLKNQYQR